MENLRSEFEQKGYVVLDDLLDDSEIAHYIDELHRIGEGRKKKSWTVPDGVIANQSFWPAIFNTRLLDKLKLILGPDIAMLQHNDLHMGYSSFAWHRDSINRRYRSNLPDWKEADDPYQLVRCGFYLQPEESDFHLGVLPGSHKMTDFLSDQEFLKQDKKLTNFQNVKVKLGMKDYLLKKADWVKTKPGTCIVFDPRLIHTGGGFEAMKYSFFIAYGIVNRHFREHYTYYRHLRKDLKYQQIPTELVGRLKDADLYAGEEIYNEKIDGAWVPSSAFSFVADFFE